MPEVVTLVVENNYSITWQNKEENFVEKIKDTIKNLTDKDIENAKEKILKCIRQQQNDFTLNNYLTRAQQVYCDTILLKIEFFDIQIISDLRLFFATIYPDIHIYFNKFSVEKITDTYLDVSFDNNSLVIKGNILSLYHMIISNSLLNIFIRCSITNLSQEQFDKNIKKKKYSKEIENETCSICLEPFKKNNIICETSCKHLFHYHCIHQWLCHDSLKPECPCCRKLQFTLYNNK